MLHDSCSIHFHFQVTHLTQFCEFRVEGFSFKMKYGLYPCSQPFTYLSDQIICDQLLHVDNMLFLYTCRDFQVSEERILAEDHRYGLIFVSCIALAICALDKLYRFFIYLLLHLLIHFICYTSEKPLKSCCDNVFLPANQDRHDF